MRENDKTHDEEVSNLRTALENNTIVMQQLVDKLNVQLTRKEKYE